MKHSQRARFELLLIATGFATIASAQTARPANRDSFRVLQWNVSDSAWIRKEPETRAVLRHANADVILLIQLGTRIDAQEVKRMLSGIRGPQDTVWFVSFRGAPNAEHTAIASRDSVRELAEFETVPMPVTGAEAERMSPPDSEKATARAHANVPAAGAVVRIGSRHVFVVAMHFTCCGTIDSWREYRRRMDARLVRDRIRSAATHLNVDGIVAAGDMNLVSGRVALDTILSSVTKPPLGPMRRAEALHADGWTNWTWDGTGTPFNGGQLDNVTYSSGRLRVLSARVWDTEDMPADSLRAHGLTSGTSRSINRHRPVVVDFSFIPRS